ncbi:MAG TPA: YhcH/YjgK/YiaL family protein [Opitutaceae bacterium]|nr:YhcH/YjgK/YiaL family protein [Opitutaceae bacterium]
MAIFGPLSAVCEQTAGLSWLQPAFPYLADCIKAQSEAQQKIFSLPTGDSFRRELSDGIFAIEQAYLTKPRTEGKFESHRRYLDIQVVIAGEEMMDIADLGLFQVKDPYIVERDLAFYHDISGFSSLWIRAGEAAIFFPQDVHKPSLQIASPQLVRKTVVKVPVPA